MGLFLQKIKKVTTPFDDPNYFLMNEWLQREGYPDSTFRQTKADPLYDSQQVLLLNTSCHFHMNVLVLLHLHIVPGHYTLARPPEKVFCLGRRNLSMVC